MPLITLNEIDSRLKTQYASELIKKSARKIFEENTKQYPMDFEFDIFLSHSYSDAQINLERLLGIKSLLEEFGYSVYVDWIIDNGLNRENVNQSTAAILRKRMSNSQCLLFATSENSQSSKWMPWELGYKDGQSSDDDNLGLVAILPLAQSNGNIGYNGQEYLSMYPYVVKARNTNGTPRLWVHKDEESYVVFDDWLNGVQPIKRN